MAYSVVDLSGYALRFEVLSSPGGNVLMTLSEGDGIAKGGHGQIEVFITDEVTAALPFQNGIWLMILMFHGLILSSGLIPATPPRQLAPLPPTESGRIEGPAYRPPGG